MVRPIMMGLVLGGADCVWDDLRALEAMAGPWPGTVVAVNTIGALWPHRLDHWATLHPEKMGLWIEARAENGHPPGFTIWAHELDRWHSKRGRELVDRTLPVPMKTGSSGLFAVDVARAVGCERVVLCGVPMTASPHFGRSEAWPEADRYWPRWVERLAELSSVRSMSGRTRDLLGAPSPGWLAETVPC